MESKRVKLEFANAMLESEMEQAKLDLVGTVKITSSDEIEKIKQEIEARKLELKQELINEALNPKKWKHNPITNMYTFTSVVSMYNRTEGELLEAFNECIKQPVLYIKKRSSYRCDCESGCKCSYKVEVRIKE